MSTRFAALVAHIRAGTLPRPRAPRRRPAAPPRPRPQNPLPRRFGWLLRLVPPATAGASRFQNLLADPELVALIAAAPQMGRLLRPLCRMLGVRPPQALVLPRKPVPAAAPAAPRSTPPPATPPPVRRRRVKRPAPIGSPGACGPPVSA